MKERKLFKIVKEKGKLKMRIDGKTAFYFNNTLGISPEIFTMWVNDDWKNMSMEQRESIIRQTFKEYYGT